MAPCIDILVNWTGGVLTNVMTVVVKETFYCRKFKTLVKDLNDEQEGLESIRKSMQVQVQKARNNTAVPSGDIEPQLKKAADLLKKANEQLVKAIASSSCCNGVVPNFICRYVVGKKSENITNKIRQIKDDLQQRLDFAYRSSLRAMSIPDDIIPFETTTKARDEIITALKYGTKKKIGLYGMGGCGKSSMLKLVHKEAQDMHLFDKIAFVEVSDPPSIPDIQQAIASQLRMELGEGNVAKILWTAIANEKKTVLIILDDMWEGLNLRDVGIPCDPNHWNCCVLIITRHLKVCKAMECQPIIHLQTLTDQDALNLFIEHVGERSDGPFNEFMQYAQEIVHECEGLPNAVVAIATALKNCPLEDWKIALETLKRSEPLHNVDEDMAKVYKSLKLSYDRLEDNRTKDVLLLCALFPKGYEISIDLLCKLSIGLGLFEEVHNYLAAIRKAIRSLLSSSLLLEAKKTHVKMHSMVRGMALWVSEKDLQVIMDSRTTVKSHIRFLFWSRDEFPNRFDGTKLELEILVLWIKGKVRVEDSCTIFQEMTTLRGLFLRCHNDHNYVTLSLKLLHSLKNIRTLILDGWKLSDMSVLKSLHGIEILELTNCLIKELPNEISKLKKLRSLGLIKCKIERNNPFEVIERCTQLEELDFVLNSKIEEWKEEGDRQNMDYVVPDVSPPTLTRYSIACPHLKYFDHDDNGMLNCFNTENVRNLISDAMFMNIVRTAEVLELGEIRGAGWNSLVPDFIAVENGGMNDLIKLCLYSLVDMECLIDASNYGHGSEVTVFSNLVELFLDGVNVRILYRGHMISGFLCKLQILKLRNCKKLRNIFFDKNLKLPHLKVLHLINCPMFQSSIFQSSVARSLEQLEELIIRNFEELRTIVAYESLGEEKVVVDDKNSFGTLFPKLKTLEIEECRKLELISPLLLYPKDPPLEAIIIRKCEVLEYIFGECRGHRSLFFYREIMLLSLTKLILDGVPNFITIFRECNIDTQDHTVSPELPASTEGLQTFHPAQRLLRGPLKLQNLRQMTIVQCSNLMSLFTLSVARSIMLEKLTIQRCDKLKHLITNEKDDDTHIKSSYHSNYIFPKLENLLIVDCRNMESIFPYTSSVILLQLKFVIIGAAPKLKYVFGRFGGREVSNVKRSQELSIDLPALETLNLTDVPNIISFCTNGRQLNLKTAKKLPASMKGIQTFHTAQCLMNPSLKRLENIRQMTIAQCSNLMSLLSVSIAKAVKLEKLTIQRCDKLKHVVTNEEEDEDHMECISILPELDELVIVDCKNIESIFPSTCSARLQKLKFVIIRAAPKLKYVFGRFFRGECLSNENENKEPYVDVPALETISLTNVPNIIGICTNGKQLSLETAMNLTSQGAAKSEIEEIIEDQRPMTSSVSTDVVSFQNVREIKIIECRKIKAMFPASTWRSLSQLCKLFIVNCEELVHVVDEDLKNCNLPKLEYLQIQNCKKLVFIFPSSFLGGLPRLKSIIVEKAADLTYIFGDYLPKENENSKLDGDLSALERLSLRDVPNIINICAKRYSVRFSSLQQISLDNCQLTRDSLNLMVYWKPTEDAMKIRMTDRKLTNLEIGNSTLDEVFNLEGVKIGGKVRLSLQSMVLKNLSELKQMCKGPNRILNLYDLRSLKVIGCKRLRAIFSFSILKSFPHLSHLKIKDCDELVHIIEEDPKETAADGWEQLCFPKLENVHIQCCDSLKFLFSISTPNMFPKLERLEIEEASELDQIFIWKQDVAQKIMVVKDAFPNLTYLRLIKLPKLVTIGCGIGFQTLPDYQVIDCPKYQENASQQVQQEPQKLGLDDQAATEALSYTGQINSLRNSAENARKAMKRNVEEVPTSNGSSEATLPPSSTFKIGLSTEKKLKEIEAKEPTPALEKHAFGTSTANALPRKASFHPSKPQQHVSPSHRIRLEEYSKIARLHHGNQLAIIIKFEPEIYGQDSEEILGNELINEILKHEMASTGAINLYIRYLHKEFVVPLGLSERFRFISPHAVASYEAIMKVDKLEEQSMAIANFFIANAKGKDTLFLVPYLQKGHWMLIVINPKMPNIWFLDPLNGEASCRPEMLELFNNALGMYRTYANLNCPPLKDGCWDSIYKWKEIKCPRQPDQSLDCGYCVMKFMKDIVIHKLNTIPNNYFNDTYCTKYSHLQIKEVIEELAMTVYDQWSASKSIDCISKERVQEVHITEDVEVATMPANLARENLSATLIILLQEEISLDLRKTKPRSETIMTPQQEQREISAVSVGESIPRETKVMQPKLHNSTIYSEEGGSKSGPCPIVDKETGKKIDKAVLLPKLPTAKATQDSEVDDLKETGQHPFQEHDKSKDRVAIQQKRLGLRTQSGLLSDNSTTKELSMKSETGKEVVGIAIASEASATTISSNMIKRVDSVKETMGQSLQEHDASPQATIVTPSADLETRKQSKTVEQTGYASVQEEQIVNASKPDPPNAIPSLYQHDILEIFQLVELKEGEGALLARALEKYPQLLLPRQQQIRETIAFSYRVLVDILVVLDTKTPCTITTSEKSTLKNNLCGAALLGFDKGWVDSVRAKVFDIDMSVSSAQENIRVMEAELETQVVRLKQVQNEKEAARRHLDLISSELSDVLKDHEILMTNMSKFRDIISAKNTPYGI